MENTLEVGVTFAEIEIGQSAASNNATWVHSLHLGLMTFNEFLEGQGQITRGFPTIYVPRNLSSLMNLIQQTTKG